MNWSQFTCRPGVALDRVLAGETIVIEHRNSMWKLRLRPLKPGEVETSPREVWRCGGGSACSAELWDRVKAHPILISRYGKIEAVLEVCP